MQAVKNTARILLTQVNNKFHDFIFRNFGGPFCKVCADGYYEFPECKVKFLLNLLVLFCGSSNLIFLLYLPSTLRLANVIHWAR